jgi:DNA-binding phage protein
MARPRKDRKYKFKDNPEKTAAYLADALKKGDAAFTRALMDVVSDFGFQDIADRAGIRRETLFRYRRGTQPLFEILLAVMAEVGVRFDVVPATPERRKS